MGLSRSVYIATMRMATVLTFYLVTLVSVHAQNADTAAVHHYPLVERHDEITLLTGYHQGRYGFAELGFGRNQWGVNRHPYDIAYYLGAELRVDRPELVGVKVGAYAAGGFALGVQLVHYFYRADRCLVFRPVIGIGLFKFNLTYAYNVALTQPRMDGINTHMLCLSYCFRLKRLSRDGQQWQGH